MKKPITEIEAQIRERLESLAEEFDLDTFEINEEREAIYKANGWSYDPFPEGEEDEDEEEEDEYEGPIFLTTMSRMLWEIGMTERDFF